MDKVFFQILLFLSLHVTLCPRLPFLTSFMAVFLPVLSFSAPQRPPHEHFCFSNQQVIDFGSMHQGTTTTASGHGGQWLHHWILSLLKGHLTSYISSYNRQEFQSQEGKKLCVSSLVKSFLRKEAASCQLSSGPAVLEEDDVLLVVNVTDVRPLLSTVPAPAHPLTPTACVTCAVLYSRSTPKRSFYSC